MGWGAYGKIPALGDFVRIGLPQGFAGPWDEWLQKGMIDARRRFGTEFGPHYNVAPVWRFALSPGLAGPAAAGVLIPSVDRVGRTFPLTLVAAVRGAAPDPSGASGMAEAEEAALDALDPLSGPEALRAALSALEVPEGPPAPPGALFWTEGRRFHDPALEPGRLADLLLGHAEAL